MKYDRWVSNAKKKKQGKSQCFYHTMKPIFTYLTADESYFKYVPSISTRFIPLKAHMFVW
jgi:hypothetical protein